MNRLTQRIAVLSISAGLSALTLEGTLRIFYEAPPDWIDPQTRHLRSPLLGWALPPNTASYTIDAPVRVNAHGLRDDELTLEKPEGERRILCLGDSFTFALGVRFEDLYVQQLEAALNRDHAPMRFQVINAGVAGYNTRQELLYLKAQGLRFEPDVITVGFYWNDLMDNEAPMPDLETTPIYASTEQFEPGGGHTIPPWMRNRLRRLRLLYLGVGATKNAMAALFPTSEIARVQRALLRGEEDLVGPLWRSAEQRLREIADLAQERRIPVVLVAFPMENQIRKEYPRMVWGERLRQIWEPTGMPFVDLEPAYLTALHQGVNPFLPYDLHPSPAGMRIAAEALYAAIVPLLPD